MPQPPSLQPVPLRRPDLHTAIDVIGNLTDALDDGEGFARASVEQLPRLAASELTTLSVCDMRSGRRLVAGVPPGTIDADARACFDRHFHEHPLVRYHGHEHGQEVRRISDSVPTPVFRRTALYAEYYRRIGIDHALALPLHSTDGWLVSVVLNRRGRDFSDREVALFGQVQRVLARLFRRTRLLERTHRDWRGNGAGAEPPALAASLPLTWREREVLRWAAAGKTDRDIAEILAISHRTVHKHLQRVYSKLGVETRTAAVMRAISRA